jgi:DNA-directed RNA polymerase subunit RPC12/RpoP
MVVHVCPQHHPLLGTLLETAPYYCDACGTHFDGGVGVGNRCSECKSTQVVRVGSRNAKALGHVASPKFVCDGTCAGNELGDCNHGDSNDGLQSK